MNFSMNSAMNAMNAVNNAPAGKVAANATPGEPGQAPDGVVLPGAPTPAPALAAQLLPFQQWIAIDGALPDVDAAAPVDGAATDVIAEDAGAEQTDEVAAAEQSLVLDNMLAAMTQQVAPAALPAMMMAMPGAKRGAANDGAATLAANTTAASVQVAAPGFDALPQTAARGAVEALAPPVPLPGANPATAATVAQTLPAAPATATAAAAQNAASAPTAMAEAAPADGADAAPTTTSAGVAAATSQPASARGADSVVLAGPPTAWRQTLQEALGDRLQLQLGRGLEQATIRLEPPMLGRIDISVRHSGGNLEVHIAASNSEVLRQLNTVSDTLRNDLAGRQYSNVAVTVSETPRAQASAQAGNQPSGQPGADAQNRGRQQGEDEQRQRTPGLALNDAGDANSPFSMHNRE